MATKVLVTGGAGYIGSILIPRLLDSGYDVTVVDNFMYKQTSLVEHIIRNNFKLIINDVRNTEAMKKIYSKHDIIIPLAAIVGAPACDKDPVLASSVNKASIIELLTNIHQDQIVIMPTTNSAYGSGDSNNFCDENSSLNPLSLYAKDKVEVEKILMERSNSVSFRLATVFGLSPRMRLDLLVNNFVFRAVTDGFIVIFEGEFKRNYIHISDVASAFQSAIKSPSNFIGEIFNVGLSEANISKIDLCKKIAEILPAFTYIESPIGKDPDQRNYIVSNKKIESRGFMPKISLEQGLSELISGIKIFNNKPYSNI
jgi:nucleoside-diphosphate-sugar epimerase